jgi:hypothetical protein
MQFRTRFVFLAFAAVAVMLAAGSKSSPPEQEPRYDPATVVDVRIIVVDVREVANGNPLAGVHLTARSESTHGNSEALDVYIGPTEFLKQMDLAFSARDKMEIVGSKVKVGGATVILTRELQRNDSTLYLRDTKGEPIWKSQLKDPA